MDLILILPILIVTLGLGLWIFRPKKKKLSTQVLDRAIRSIENTKKFDPNHALMDSHKHFVAAIESLFPQEKLNAAKLINKVYKRFPNEKSVWRFHRLRNRAAHQTNFEVYEETAKAAREEFIRALKSLS